MKIRDLIDTIKLIRQNAKNGRKMAVTYWEDLVDLTNQYMHLLQKYGVLWNNLEDAAGDNRCKYCDDTPPCTSGCVFVPKEPPEDEYKYPLIQFLPLFDLKEVQNETDHLNSNEPNVQTLDT